MRTRVLIIQRRLPEYRVAMFDRLKALLAAEDVRLTVVHGDPMREELARRDEGVLPWAVRVRSRYARLGGMKLVHHDIPRGLLANQALVVLPHENAILASYALVARRLLGGARRVAYWGHGPTAGERLRERFKRWTAPRVDWWFAYTQLSVDRVLATGFPAERITRLDNAIDTATLRRWAASITEEERQALRAELGISTDNVAVFLGSLSREKRVGFLLEVADTLRTRIPDLHLVVVGDGPERPILATAARSRPWLHAVGARHDREKALYCSLARVNLNPGMVGLGIVDSFVLGTPLVTTQGNIHSPEIAYLIEEENGLLVPDSVAAFVDAAERVLRDGAFRAKLVAGCQRAASDLTVERMAERYAGGLLAALGSRHGGSPRTVPARVVGTPRTHPATGLRIAVVWQRYLPYHEARLRHLRAACEAAGIAVHPIEVASNDATYGFPMEEPRLDRHCCFPGSVYHEHSATEVFSAVRDALERIGPDVVFAPAVPFPEGMAAVAYRNATGARMFMMDDAWERTDQRGWLTRGIKRLIHRTIDGAFVPAASHDAYYQSLGFAPDRIVHGVDVVDNAHFSQRAERARRSTGRQELGLPNRYFLFVGRFIQRKGIAVLLQAYAAYRDQTDHPFELVLVGGTAGELPTGSLGPGVNVLGRRFGEALCPVYALAEALVVPSDSDPWGLVVNEGMASGLAVIVSRGCGASTLVDEGINGWTFEPGDARALAALLLEASRRDEDTTARMRAAAEATISQWGPERFTRGVLDALSVSRALPAGNVSSLVARAWRGRVRVY